jgi:hypothetical protein
MGSGRGQGGQSAGMAGSVPPGGIASMLGQMPSGMGGPLPQQGGMMGGQQAMQPFGQQQGGMMGQMPQGGPQMGFGQAMMGGQQAQGGPPMSFGQSLMGGQAQPDVMPPQQGAMGGFAGLMGNRPSFVMDGQIPPGGIPSQSEMLMQAQQGGKAPLVKPRDPRFAGSDGTFTPKGGPSMVNPPRPQVRPRPQGGMGLASMMRGGSR